MIAGTLGELGQIALIVSLVVALLLATLPLIGAWRNDARLMSLAPSLTVGLFVFVTAAFGVLVAAFVLNDFTVAYVANHSNLLLPTHYRITAVWGGHEGSLLLWVMMLSGWMIAVVAFSRSLTPAFLARVLAIMAWIVIGFLLFTLLTSNPFDRLLPGPPDGADLNPLLQDPGMIFHPPLLYMGYVGFAVAFAFAVAGLLGGRVERDWVRWSRPWTLAAWSFLTGGIALGSWWAYYELGWGGWWFWDPVENASFMPWLVGTALIHSQAVTEKRNAFPAWTVLLAIAAFSLSLLGTFLVRSGVLTSVHAFANDPERGLFILAFLGIVTGGALLLFLLRAPKLAAGEGFDWFSRETLLLANNLLLVVSAAMVLLGTLFPILNDFMGWGQVSVGPPYFSAMFILLMTPLVMLLPFGPMSQWKQDTIGRTLKPLIVPAIVAILGGVIIAGALDAFTLRAVTGWIGGLWLVFGALAFVARAARSSSGLLRGHWGMVAAHLGVGVFVIGVAMVESATAERDFAMSPGDTIETAGLAFRLDEIATVKGPNWSAEEARFTVLKDGEVWTTMAPQKRRYYRSGQLMTQVALEPGVFRDLYIAMGQPLDGEAWSIRVHVKPFIRWIWGGAVLMLIGGLMAATDPRYRRLAAHAAHRSSQAGTQPVSA